ncbi:MAG: hypothetical protein LBJ67_09025 [Planctomycetaceae bacterium]|nr:hypothetical protein [Planctomycetaceae bacterium]
MRKIWFWGIGVALFSAAGLMYVAGHHSDQSGMRSVGEEESALVQGGGQSGYYVVATACGVNGVEGCNGNSGYRNDTSGGGKTTTGGLIACGSDSCNGVSVYSGTGDAPE